MSFGMYRSVVSSAELNVCKNKNEIPRYWIKLLTQEISREIFANTGLKVLQEENKLSIFCQH